MSFQLRLLPADRENEVQRETLQGFRTEFPPPYAWWERNNTGGTHTPTGRFLRFGLGKGGPDIIGCVRGRMVAVECKRPGEKLRPEQVAWRDRHIAAGGIYVVSTDALGAVRALKAELERAA